MLILGFLHSWRVNTCPPLLSIMICQYLTDLSHCLGSNIADPHIFRKESMSCRPTRIRVFILTKLLRNTYLIKWKKPWPTSKYHVKVGQRPGRSRSRLKSVPQACCQLRVQVQKKVRPLTLHGSWSPLVSWKERILSTVSVLPHLYGLVVSIRSCKRLDWLMSD